MITAHDRWFLDRITTHILASEGSADWSWFDGDFAGYKADKIDRLGAEATGPRRVTHRRLGRA